MTSDAIFDVYFPDGFVKYRNDNNCYVVLGTQVKLDCVFSSYASGYVYKVSIQKACPNNCDQSTSYYFNIPIQTRGDNYAVGGSWKIVCRYAYLDMGIGTLANTLSVTPDTIVNYYITNMGCD